jgi:hypothetical protein
MECGKKRLLRQLPSQHLARQRVDVVQDLKLLVHEALSYWYVRPLATSTLRFM